MDDKERIVKIAIIGSGISGLTCAYYLNKHYDIHLYEANDYIGGHTATKEVNTASGQYKVDTGFIVFNDRTYPHFRRLLSELGIQEQKTEMSFSVTNEDNGLEYNGHNLSSFFAQRKNLLNPAFYHFIYEILRFNKKALAAYKKQDEAFFDMTLGAFLKREKLSDYVSQNYILPMGAAIWSSTLSDMRSLPLRFFLAFFHHHGLLHISNRPQWFVIPNGSCEYVKKITATFKDKIYLNTPVKKVIRYQDKVELVTADKTDTFDQVIFACHSDQALALLAAPSFNEKRLLSRMKYQDNEVILHTDHTLLPQNKRAWASWNYHLGQKDKREKQLASLTYNMNILQGIQSPETFCVSLNSSERICPDKIIEQFTYAHPVFDEHMIKAQTERSLISGCDRTWYCGAYWYNGFHEDGVKSGLDVVRQLLQLQKEKHPDLLRSA